MSLLGMSWQFVLGGTITGLLAYANLPSAWILPQKAATETFLASAKLKALSSGKEVSNTRSLWEQNGAVIMAVRRPG